MIYIVVSEALLSVAQDKRLLFTRLPDDAKGHCLWFSEKRPPLKAALVLYDFACFPLTLDDQMGIINKSRVGTSITQVCREYLRTEWIGRVKRIHQGTLFNIFIASNVGTRSYPDSGYFSENPVEFRYQLNSLYAVSWIPPMDSKDPEDHQHYKGAMVPRRTRSEVKTGNIAVRINELHRAGATILNSDTLPIKFPYEALSDPPGYVRTYLERVQHLESKHAAEALRHLRGMLARAYKSNRRYPAYNNIGDIKVTSEFVATLKHATREKQWYELMDKVANTDPRYMMTYVELYHYVLCHGTRETHKAVKAALRSVAHRPTPGTDPYNALLNALSPSSCSISSALKTLVLYEKEFPYRYYRDAYVAAAMGMDALRIKDLSKGTEMRETIKAELMEQLQHDLAVEQVLEQARMLRANRLSKAVTFVKTALGQELYTYFAGWTVNEIRHVYEATKQASVFRGSRDTLYMLYSLGGYFNETHFVPVIVDFPIPVRKKRLRQFRYNPNRLYPAGEEKEYAPTVTDAELEEADREIEQLQKKMAKGDLPEGVSSQKTAAVVEAMRWMMESAHSQAYAEVMGSAPALKPKVGTVHAYGRTFDSEADRLQASSLNRDVLPGLADHFQRMMASVQPSRTEPSRGEPMKDKLPLPEEPDVGTKVLTLHMGSGYNEKARMVDAAREHFKQVYLQTVMTFATATDMMTEAQATTQMMQTLLPRQDIPRLLPPRMLRPVWKTTEPYQAVSRFRQAPAENRQAKGRMQRFSSHQQLPGRLLYSGDPHVIRIVDVAAIQRMWLEHFTNEADRTRMIASPADTETAMYKHRPTFDIETYADGNVPFPVSRGDPIADIWVHEEREPRRDPSENEEITNRVYPAPVEKTPESVPKAKDRRGCPRG
ncbi:Hypothetical protein POVN_LOCUS633 [uncultured virus]|nr:Hypothetical protein POVN_LOCUS633 [uncultured virus]